MKHIINKVITFGLLTSSFANIQASDEGKKMNVILIMADDFGYECLGVNGSDSYKTPNIDRLAQRGIKFNYCHSNPLSTPTRVQLMTGKYNARNYTAFGKLERKEVTFGNILKEAGYATCIAGKWQLGKELDSPQHFGFEQSCLWQHANGAYDSHHNDSRYANPILEYNSKKKEYINNEFGPDIDCDFIINFIRENKSRPFFAYYPMILTHAPFIPTPGSPDWAGKRSESSKGDPRYFPGMVQYTDMLVGRIIDEIDKLGLTDNTLIIFTGDNGTDRPILSSLNGKPYPGGKGQTIDSGTHVPLIVSYPGGEKGTENNNLIDFTDFLPTLCDVAKVDIPVNIEIDGQSFYPQLKGETKGVREWIYCWYAPRDVDDKKAKVFARNHQYKLYRSGEFYDVVADFNEEKPIPANMLDENQKRSHQMLQDVINKNETIISVR